MKAIKILTMAAMATAVLPAAQMRMDYHRVIILRTMWLES